MEIVLFRIRTRPSVDEKAYEQAYERMLEEVNQVPGFVDIVGYTSEDGSELAVARFETPEAIAQWRDHPDHVATRDRGRNEFFDEYEITIGTVWRNYSWRRGN